MVNICLNSKTLKLKKKESLSTDSKASVDDDVNQRARYVSAVYGSVSGFGAVVEPAPVAVLAFSTRSFGSFKAAVISPATKETRDEEIEYLLKAWQIWT